MFKLFRKAQRNQTKSIVSPTGNNHTQNVKDVSTALCGHSCIQLLLSVSGCSAGSQPCSLSTALSHQHVSVVSILSGVYYCPNGCQVLCALVVQILFFAECIGQGPEKETGAFFRGFQWRKCNTGTWLRKMEEFRAAGICCLSWDGPEQEVMTEVRSTGLLVGS